jgi:hypothetical protein
MKLIATKKHTREFQNAITLKVGDVVKIDLTRGSHWLGNVFCTLPDGNSGWVTKWAFENLEGSEAIVEQNYCSVELGTEIGDVLEGYANTQTATWCSNAKGESGWVSFDCLEDDDLERNKRMADLITKIEFAFADKQKGNGIGFREAGQIDATSIWNENWQQLIVEAREQDSELWFEVPESVVEIGFGVHWWTNNEGYCFMLPAIMRLILRQMLESRAGCEEYVMSDIASFARKPNGIYWLTDAQIAAFARYCEMMLDFGIYSLGGATPIWQRDYVQSLLEIVGESLSPEWFKAPV